MMIGLVFSAILSALVTAALAVALGFGVLEVGVIYSIGGVFGMGTFLSVVPPRHSAVL